MRRLLFRCGLGLLAALVLSPALAQDKIDGVEMKVVKYDGLADTVKGLKGKVVVVDFWEFY